MKKLKYLFIALMLVLLPLSTVSAKGRVNVYLFRGEGCPHCAAAEEFFDSLSEDSEYSSYFDVEDYEVWYDEDNAKLMEDVAKELDTTANGVPFIVIGKKYFSGYAESMNTEIKDAIKDAYNSYSYVDVVDKIENGYNKDTYDKDVEDDIEDDIKDELNISDSDVEFLKSLLGVGIGIIIVSLFISLAILVFYVIIYWKLFKKAGKNGWEAIVPFYNTWTLFEISGYPGYYMFFALIPCVGSIVYLVFYIMAMISLSKKFNKEAAYAILLILLPIIGFAILAFDNSEYDNSLGENKN